MLSLLPTFILMVAPPDSTPEPAIVDAAAGSSPTQPAQHDATSPTNAPVVAPPVQPEKNDPSASARPPAEMTAPPPAREPAAPARPPAFEPRSPDELYEGGIKFELGSGGQSSIRLITWHQVWNRYTQTNPGTQVQGRPRDHQYDIGLRRSRVLLLGQLTSRFQVITHFGINNQTFNNARKPQLFVHEATGQLRVWKDALHVGAGLHYWHGISRMTNASTLNMMSLDAPILNWPTIERADQFARHLGIYAKGKLGPIDYRFAFNQPFATGTGEEEGPTTSAATYDPRANSKMGAGYVQWQMFDRESNAVPYAVGTYLGKKRVLNLGAGFSYQPKGTWSRSESGEILTHDIILLGADLFADIPFRQHRGALTAYGAYYYYDFGPDHLRSIGIMNTGTGGTTLGGPGNAYPTIGTGHHVYGQIGYMLPSRWTGLQRLQGYLAAQVSAFDALDDPVLVPEAGINWLLLGHHSKLTLMYRSRPIVSADEVTGRTREITRRSEVILQTMIYF